VLEAVGAAAPQNGRERAMLRACIQIRNANLRFRSRRRVPRGRRSAKPCRGSMRERAPGGPIAGELALPIVSRLQTLADVSGPKWSCHPPHHPKHVNIRLVAFGVARPEMKQSRF